MRKFRTELLLYFIVLIIVLLTVVGVLFYSWSKQIIGQKVSASTVETLKQIDQNISLILGSVRDISLYIISNHKVRTFLKFLDEQAASVNKSKLYGSFSVLPNSANYISSINIYGENGLELETGGPFVGGQRRCLYGVRKKNTSRRVLSDYPHIQKELSKFRLTVCHLLSPPD